MGDHINRELSKQIERLKKGMSEEEIRAWLGDKLPKNYAHKPNTVIMIDDKDRIILHDNGDGTVSGIDVKAFYE